MKKAAMKVMGGARAGARVGALMVGVAIGGLALGGLALGGLALGGAASAQTVAPTAATSSTENDEVAEQRGRDVLSSLSKQKQAAYQLEGDARTAALRTAAAGYEAASNDASLRAAEKAEAAFRAGEVFRTARDIEGAKRTFGVAAKIGVGSDGEVFAARAVLEQGHIARRDKQYDEATEFYTSVTKHFEAHVRPAAHAWTWRGKVAIQQEQWQVAGQAVRAFGEGYASVYPVEALRNAERLARALIGRGHRSDADALKTAIEAQIEGAREAWNDDAEAVDEALGEFRVTFLDATR